MGKQFVQNYSTKKPRDLKTFAVFHSDLLVVLDE